MRKDAKGTFDWSGRIEHLEERLAMSADPLGGAISHHSLVEEAPTLGHHQESADFWMDLTDEELLAGQLQEIEQALASAHTLTGLTTVRNTFGFTGIGQTVAVIDSGIAYNHFALGGGFGSNYRVVGGWDFAENDSNPFDDGPDGSHGTHVSGIVGASGGTNTGVAPGVDLVGLRVFNDIGDGYFSWVENALRWVHNNRNNFENPITAVNLSLGTEYNATTVPNWTTLEDEFAQLEADGIFIAVSAGNSFTNYNTTGLSYPAASPYVVPVMSVDDNGALSYFSQRHSRAIAAPGRTIVSTVPDYAGNNNGAADDYASFSGTSMASPYVAGASVIIRQAMEFVGRTNITQDAIFDHMMATADSFFDSATSQSYKRLNMSAAINALMPTDDYGSTSGAAFNLGTLGESSEISGVISTLSDNDYFRFTAGTTGTVTFEASNLTHELAAEWLGAGQVSGANNEFYTIDVVAGQTYTVGFSSTAGLGYYDLGITSETAFTYTDWGNVSFTQLANLSLAGENWYRVESTAAGYLTVDASYNAGGGSVTLGMYSSNMQLLATGNAVGGTSRVDVYCPAGTEYYICVLGTNSDIDFRLTNLVSLNGTTVEVTGTSGNDLFTFTAGTTHLAGVNGVSYSFAANSITGITFTGGASSDIATMVGTAGSETATMRVGDATLTGTGFTARALGVEYVTINALGGADVANVYDSTGNDTFTGSQGSSSLSGAAFSLVAAGFEEVYANSTAGGTDAATLNDSAGDDVFFATPTYNSVRGTNFFVRAWGFESAVANATAGGADHMKIYDSAGNDQFTSTGSVTRLVGTGFDNSSTGFENVDVFATAGGADTAVINDTAGDDHFYTKVTYAMVWGTNYYNRVRGFDTVDAYSTAGGYDLSKMYDSAGNDTFTAGASVASMVTAGVTYRAHGFDRVYGFASTGSDFAVLNDSAGSDRFYGTTSYSVMYGTGFYNYVTGFDLVRSVSTLGGGDIAYLYDSTGNDTFEYTSTYSRLAGSGFAYQSEGFATVRAYMSQGADSAYFYDLGSGETFYGSGSLASLLSAPSDVRGYTFDEVTAYSSTGQSCHAQVSALDYVFNQVGNWS